MCQRAGLLIGWDYESGRALVTRADCDSWQCPECAARMKDRWILRAQIGTRKLREQGYIVDFATITGHERLKTFEACEAVWRDVWSKLYDALKWKQPHLEYLCVPEKHKNGRMHVHLLWNAAVSQRWLKDNTRRRGGGHQAKINHEPNELAISRYVAKYLGKTLGTDMPKRFRRVRVSQGWAEIPVPENELTGLEWTYHDTNGKLLMAYSRAQRENFHLIDLETGAYFDDVDLGTITE